MKKMLLLTIAAVLPAAWTSGAQAQALTREQGDAILQELRAIRGLLERQQAAPTPAQPPAPERVKVSVKGAQALGQPDAPLTMVAFIDYECPFCRRFDAQTYPEIKRQWIDTGKVRYVVRDLPLEFHKNAMKAAEATHCAAEQGKYWEYRARLGEADRLEAEHLPRYANEVGVLTDPFVKCLDSGRYAKPMQQSLENALGMGISGTPTFVIGRTAQGEVVEGLKVVGAQPYGNFEARFKELLQ